MKKALLLLAKILAVAVFFALMAYIAAWLPVIDRFNDPCKYYPNLTTDC